MIPECKKQLETTSIFSFEFLKNFVAAGCSAALSKTASAPIERIKLILQGENEILMAKRLKTPYKGIFDCMRKIYQNEGMLSFYRGNGASVLRYFPTQGLNFAMNDKLKELIPKPKESEENFKAKKLLHGVLAGGIAGSVSQALLYTLDFSRTRLANDILVSDLKGSDARQFKGLKDVYVKTYNAEGLRGLHSGLSISIVKMFLYRGAYFGFYDFTKSHFEIESALGRFLNAYIVTFCAQGIGYPFDTINKKLIMTSGESFKYTSSIDCFKKAVQLGGLKSMYRGFSIFAVRSFAGAGVLALYDQYKLAAK